nr:PREDICTED: proclotting enzyme isoform X3 [Tribolium castaneum]|eukprot:XP_008196144.1 PREDICTED: proclotting enzyme isoform X3 [Tribolium castaneum]
MFKLISIIVFVHHVRSQNPSPCPEIFSYEPRGQEEDRWYGVVSLQTAEDLDGVWLKITLDRPAELLGNWFGEAHSSDNQEFTIRNPRYKLEAGPPVSVRFFVKYNAASTIPSLKVIKLNGKTICTSSRDDIVSTTPQLHISQIRPVTSRPNRPNNRPASSEEGAYLNTKPSSSSGNRGSAQGNHGGSSQERPSSHGGSSQERPDSYDNHQTNNYNSQSTTSSYNTNNNNNNYSNNRRPGSQSNSISNNHREHESSTNSGDFAVHRPSQARPPSKPSTLSKRNVGCGTVAMKASPLISYGQNTTQGQWPWHVALYHIQGAQLLYTCGGTLISENHVLTAAHCVAKPQTNRPIDTKDLSVYLGKYHLKKFGDGTQDRDVTDIFIHPQYNYSVYFNDIAVLKLKTPADLNNYVRPCCLWEDGTDIEYVLNKLGTVVGWGFDEKRQISDTLMQAQMPVVSTVNCIYSNREFFSQFTFEKTYCAGFRNEDAGTTVCNGDSGGGMVFPKAGTSGHNTVWQIRGIVSVGVALQGQGVCDPRHYIVFTDVAKHLDWIKQVMRE